MSNFLKKRCGASSSRKEEAWFIQFFYLFSMFNVPLDLKGGKLQEFLVKYCGLDSEVAELSL